MSIKKISITSLLVLVCGFAIGGIYSTYSQQNVKRKIASTLPMPKFYGKSHSTVKTTLHAVNFQESSENSEVKLRGDVKLLQNVDGDLYYKWILPEGVVIAEGQAEDSWANVLPGQTKTVELVVTGLTKREYQTVVLQAYGIVGGTQLGASAVFTTQEYAPHIPASLDEEAEAASRAATIQQ